VKLPKTPVLIAGLTFQHMLGSFGAPATGNPLRSTTFQRLQAPHMPVAVTRPSAHSATATDAGHSIQEMQWS